MRLKTITYDVLCGTFTQRDIKTIKKARVIAASFVKEGWYVCCDRVTRTRYADHSERIFRRGSETDFDRLHIGNATNQRF